MVEAVEVPEARVLVVVTEIGVVVVLQVRVSVVLVEVVVVLRVVVDELVLGHAVLVDAVVLVVVVFAVVPGVVFVLVLDDVFRRFLVVFGLLLQIV